jgi:hypothetical protein
VEGVKSKNHSEADTRATYIFHFENFHASQQEKAGQAAVQLVLTLSHLLA